VSPTHLFAAVERFLLREGMEITEYLADQNAPAF
jgi:hypothetical protein